MTKHKKQFGGIYLFISMLIFSSMVKWSYDDPITILPIPLHAEVLAIEPSPTPHASVSVDEVVDKIWELESNRGRAKSGHHVWCRNQGLSNDYGYNVPDGNSTFCFADHEEATTTVIKWVNKKYKMFDSNLAMTLCYYNQGKPDGVYLTDCPYYQNYLEVK